MRVASTKRQKIEIGIQHHIFQIIIIVGLVSSDQSIFWQVERFNIREIIFNYLTGAKICQQGTNYNDYEVKGGDVWRNLLKIFLQG